MKKIDIGAKKVVERVDTGLSAGYIISIGIEGNKKRRKP
jgi:hypothetical protein